METRAEQSELLTVDEVIKVLRVGRTTTNQLMWSGELPSVKVGRRRLVRRTDLERFIEAQQYQPGEGQ
jgi:excisionase family DNA binding protein